MSGIKRSAAIKDHLNNHTHADLAALYTAEMECQVNVAQDGGERIDRRYEGHQYHEYTDGVQTWKSFRIPLKAMVDPEDNDHLIKFDLGAHVEGIGMTGWNWVKRRSMWVAYDFDAILGHSEKHTKKLTESELNEIKEKVKAIEWVTLRRSTGGSGLHLYVFLDINETINNHNEHMAIGRAILSQLSAMAGFDLEAKVDVNAGNMWVWHRKMANNPDAHGLELIKQGGKLSALPKDWRDYIDVVKGKRRRTLPFFVSNTENPKQELDAFEELSNQRPKVPLDQEHQRLLDWINSHAEGGSSWRDDHWMLITHTHTLKLAHQALGLRGPYETLATGETLPDWNCYAFPVSNGGWTIRRYTRGCAEAPTWSQDGIGWTWCYYNKIPDFKTACRLNGGVEKPNGEWGFNQTLKALAAAKMLGSDIKTHESKHYSPCTLSQHRDKRLIIKIDKASMDSAGDMAGFDGSNNKSWIKIIDTKLDSTPSPIETMGIDKLIRHLVNEGGQDEGWVIRENAVSNEWRNEPLEHIKLTLKGAFSYNPKDIDAILGTAILQPYKLINRPFDVEYPPGRLWNRDAARLKFAPSQNIDSLSFPTWLKVFHHVGKNLTPYIESDPWCKANNITTGADYLIIWVAALFQQPYARKPYLFFYSEEEDTGKSTFHQAISLLMGGGDPPKGYMKVNEALKAAQTFNGELHHAIVCVVEELDLNPRRSDAKISHNRIKELVTANTISINAKHQTPCMVKNTTSWIQCSNDKAACPIFKGDTRITMIRVSPLDRAELIPPPELTEKLNNEAPDFLAHILRLEIPASHDRLIVPVINTEDKKTIQAANQTLLEDFITQHCRVMDGETILWSEFYQKFAETIEAIDLERWTKKYTTSQLPDYHPKGRRREDTQFCVGNLCWASDVAQLSSQPKKDRLILKDEKLVTLRSLETRTLTTTNGVK